MKPISSSERKGILVVASVALAISAAGFCFSRCERRNRPAGMKPEVTVLSVPDSSAGDADSLMPRKKKARKDSVGKRKAKKSRQKQPKTYRRRDPRDEIVSE